MAQLSLLVEMFKQSQGAKHNRKDIVPGMLKGATGTLGSRFFQPRNSEAGLNKEVQTMQSPIFRAFLQRMVPQTPITNFLRSR